jgi:hypothetical protein
MEARHRTAELACLLEGARVEIVVADPNGSPLERYPVESVTSGPYGFRENVTWLELRNGLLVGLVTPAPPPRQPLQAGAG